MRIRKKKKKKKKNSTFQKELEEQSEYKGLSEVLPITIKRSKDEINIELQLEDIQNENYTELHNLVQRDSEPHERDLQQ